LPEPPPTLLVPPDPDDAASIVAKFAKFHEGWVVVYGDGRVIKSAGSGEGSEYLGEGSEYLGGGLMFERHLTAKGLDLVRSGAIQPREIWYNAVPQTLPTDTWADPEFQPYVASRFAACPSGLGSQAGHATDMAGRLPAAAQAALRGKELRTYREDLFSHSEVGPPDHSADTLPPAPPVECFEVSTEEAIVLFKTLRRAGFAFEWVFVIGDQDVTRPAPPPPWAGAVRGPCGGVKQPAAMEVCFRPLLPHGQWYDMPG
jgi:hypothetical protein